MTPQSQKIILTALREYKRENLRQARLASEGHAPSEDEACMTIDKCMAIDDQIELAMQEIVVAS